MSLRHVAYLVQQFPPEVGAGPARVAEMALRWRAAGIDVTVITAMPNRPAGRIDPGYRGRAFVEEEWQGIRVLRSWLFTSAAGGFTRTLANNLTFMGTAWVHALRRMPRADVLIASSPPFFPHIAGAAVAAQRRIPLVLELRDLWPDYLVGMGVLRDGFAARRLFALERALLARTARAVVVTESFARRVAEKGVPADRIDVIPNGVDAEQYYAEPDAEPPVEAMRPRCGTKVIGYLGNFGLGQGLEYVLAAAALLRDMRPDIRFVLAGDGPQRRRIEQLVDETQLTNVTLHESIAKTATRAFYNACDICLVPLAPWPVLQQTIPSKIFEVMACERPLIAVLGGEAAEILERSGGGSVVEPGNPEALAGAIGHMLRMPEDEQRTRGRNARQYVAEHFGRDMLASRYLDTLRAAAAQIPDVKAAQ
jgi:colanic acid biosynthesis glycosyl transferase WcaI